jgi:hypothetical protein
MIGAKQFMTILAVLTVLFLTIMDLAYSLVRNTKKTRSSECVAGRHCLYALRTIRRYKVPLSNSLL